MKKKRLIPVLLLKNGFLVQSKGFKRYQNLGNPFAAVKRLSEWAADEIIYLDISTTNDYDLRRDDQGYPNWHKFSEIIQDVAKVTFMPLTIGGRIHTLAEATERFAVGADKISINTEMVQNPELITKMAAQFGSQAVVVSIDTKLTSGTYRVMINGGQRDSGREVLEWAMEAEKRGAGEILLNSVDRDGSRQGYDLELLSRVAGGVKIPVVALGGVGEWWHFAEALEKTPIDAVAAANIFHYSDQSVYFAKKYLYEKGFPVRPPVLFKI